MNKIRMKQNLERLRSMRHERLRAAQRESLRQSEHLFVSLYL